MTPTAPLPVVVWSPDGIEAYSPGLKKWSQHRTLAEAKREVGSKVILALGRRQSFVRTTRLPDASRVDVLPILANQVDSLFPTPQGETAFDFYFTDDKTLEGRLAVVAASKSETLREVLAELKEAGIEAVAILPVALGSSLAAASMGLASCAFVEETAEGYAIDLVSGGSVVGSRLAPPAGRPDALRAEIGKTKASMRLEHSPLVAAGGLVIDFADSALSTRTAEFLSASLPGINLELPEDLARRERKKVESRKNLALLLWVAAVGTGAVVFDKYSDEAQRFTKQDRSWAGKEKAARDDLAKVDARVKSYRSVQDVLDRAFKAKQPIGDVLVVLNTLAPKGVWLTGLTIERGKLANLRGTATNSSAMSAYLASLTSQSRFRDVKLNFANNGMIEETPVVNFSVTTHVVGNFPISVQERK